MSPQAIPAVVAGFAGGNTFVAGAAGVFSWGAFATTALLSAVSYAVNRQAQSSDLGSSLSQTIKNPTSARRIIYGERRVGGTLVHVGSSNDDKYKHLVIALAGHEVESISDVYLNDNPLSYYNKFGNKPSATVDWNQSSGLSITVNGQTHSGSVETLIIALTARGFIVSGDGGNYEVSDGRWEDSAHLEITVASVDDILTVSSTNGTLRTNIGHEIPVIVRAHLGTSDQLADADLINELPEWTENHRLRNIAYLYVRLRYEFSAFPSGIPTVTALVQGKNDIYDPRTETSGYTNNAALCVADYLASEKYGFAAAYDEEISTAALISASNICDEQMSLATGGTENRYTCNGVIDTSVKPKTNIESLLSSMAGTAVYTGGLWTLKAGAYEAASLVLSESNLRGELTLQTKLSRTEICNGVKGVYTSPENDYQPGDIPAVTNATYLAEDNNERIWKDIDLPFTTRPAMAQRLAKIIMEQTRQGMTLTYPCNLSALPLTAGDTVNINNARLGWTNKPFRVTKWEFVVDDEGRLGIDLTLRETASGIYDWNSGEETTVDLAPNTSLSSPWYVAPITALTLTESTEVNSDGAIIPGLTVAFDASVSNVDFYRVELYLTRDDSLWASQEPVKPGCTFKNLLGGEIYRVRVTAYNRFGAHSQSVIKNVGVIGLPGPPAAPSALVATPVVGGIQWDWVNNTPEYALLGTEIYISGTNDMATATLLNTALGNSYAHAFASGTTVYAWARSVDKSATPSEWYPASATGGVVATSLTQDVSAEWEDILDGSGTKPADNADVTNYADYRVSNSQTEGAVTTIANPQGGSLSFGGSSTGVIKIALPQSWTNTMMKMVVDIFNYSTNKSFQLACGGYNYSGSPAWINEFAQILGSVDANNRVRFGHDGTHCCICIGDTGTQWSYLKVSVKDFQAGHSNYAVSQWVDGWSISVENDLTGYTFTGDFSDALLDAKSILGQGALATQDRSDLDFDDGADATAAALEAFTAITSGGLRMTDVATGDYTQMTPGEYEVYHDGVLYKAVNRVNAEESWSSGTPVVHSPAFRTTPKVTLFAKETPSYLAAYSSSDHVIELIVENNSPTGFTPYNRLILRTGNDATQNFAQSFSVSASTRTTLNTGIDTVTITLDDVYRNIATYEEVSDGLWRFVDHWYSLNIRIRYQIGSGSWVTSYTGQAYKRGSYGATFVHSITGIDSGASNVTVEISITGTGALMQNGSGSSYYNNSETVAEFVKMRELAEATQTVPGELGWLAIEAT